MTQFALNRIAEIYSSLGFFSAAEKTASIVYGSGIPDPVKYLKNLERFIKLFATPTEKTKNWTVRQILTHNVVQLALKNEYNYQQMIKRNLRKQKTEFEPVKKQNEILDPSAIFLAPFRKEELK